MALDTPFPAWTRVAGSRRIGADLTWPRRAEKEPDWRELFACLMATFGAAINPAKLTYVNLLGYLRLAKKINRLRAGKTSTRDLLDDADAKDAE